MGMLPNSWWNLEFWSSNSLWDLYGAYCAHILSAVTTLERNQLVFLTLSCLHCFDLLISDKPSTEYHWLKQSDNCQFQSNSSDLRETICQEYLSSQVGYGDSAQRPGGGAVRSPRQRRRVHRRAETKLQDVEGWGKKSAREGDRGMFNGIHDNWGVSRVESDENLWTNDETWGFSVIS